MSSASSCSIDPSARARLGGDGVRALWLDECELRTAAVGDTLHEWLTCEGLLTDRIRLRSAAGVRLRLRGQYLAIPDIEARAQLEYGTGRVLAREIELLAADLPIVYARTLIPETTLQAHPWLRDLGETPLGEALARQADLRRGPLEFAMLPTRSELYARAVESIYTAPPSSLWMRRSWFGLPGGRLLVTEVFLPAVLEL